MREVDRVMIDELVNRGVDVQVRILSANPVEATARQRDTLDELGVDVSTLDLPEGAVDLVIDAMVGYILRGNPRGVVAEYIAWTTSQPAPVLSSMSRADSMQQLASFEPRTSSPPRRSRRPYPNVGSTPAAPRERSTSATSPCHRMSTTDSALPERISSAAIGLSACCLKYLPQQSRGRRAGVRVTIVSIPAY